MPAKKKRASRVVRKVTHQVAPPRMEAIPVDKMSRAQRAAAEALIAGPRGAITGPFIALLRSPELMNRLQTVGEYIRFSCPLDKRINELVALIAARHWSQQFEWWAHLQQGLEAGLKPDIADAIAEGRRPRRLAEDEDAAYDLVVESLNNCGVSDATYARARKVFGEQRLIDVLAIAGYYGLLALIMNAARTPVPHGSPMPLPPLPPNQYLKAHAPVRRHR